MKAILIGVVALAVIWSGTYGVATPATQQAQTIQGVTVRQNGAVTIDTWQVFLPMSPLGIYPAVPMQPRKAPTRIELAADVAPDTLLCMATATGQQCKTVGAVFTP